LKAVDTVLLISLCSDLTIWSLMHSRWYRTVFIYSSVVPTLAITVTTYENLSDRYNLSDILPAVCIVLNLWWRPEAMAVVINLSILVWNALLCIIVIVSDTVAGDSLITNGWSDIFDSRGLSTKLLFPFCHFILLQKFSRIAVMLPTRYHDTWPHPSPIDFLTPLPPSLTHLIPCWYYSHRYFFWRLLIPFIWRYRLRWLFGTSVLPSLLPCDADSTFDTCCWHCWHCITLFIWWRLRYCWCCCIEVQWWKSLLMPIWYLHCAILQYSTILLLR